MAEEKRREAATKEDPETLLGAPAAQPAAAQPAQRVRISFEGVKPEYANFCTLTARGDEVFISFGKAFATSSELKADSQVVMSVRNVQQLHQAMGRLLEQIEKVQEPKK